jgi:hypothetical protein
MNDRPSNVVNAAERFLAGRPAALPKHEQRALEIREGVRRLLGS